MEPVFQDLPPKEGEKWVPVVEMLKERPGKWALILTQARVAIPNAIRNQSIKALRKDAGFEVRTRNESSESGSRLADVYLRYNPHMDVELEGHARRSAIALFNTNTGE